MRPVGKHGLYYDGWHAGFAWGIATTICLETGMAALTFLAVYWK